jgi:sulfur carrier protein
MSDDADSVATALNGEFVPKGLRQTTLLADGDHIEIIAPLEGG